MEEIISMNNKTKPEFLSEKEVIHVYNQTLKCFCEEKDLRGYVHDKGWAHSCAHVADTLASLAASEHLKHIELLNMLNAIKEKVYVDYYVYVNEEDERMINVVMNILDRKLLSDSEILQWIESFQKIEKTGYLPQDENIRENRKTFLRSLYFRLKPSNQYFKFLQAVETKLA